LKSTLGFTAFGGLPMGTRRGQLDAGIVLYLMEEKRMSAKEIERFLYNECGLKGLSGISNDVRELLASHGPRTKLALDYFVYRVSLYAGMLPAAMGGIDGSSSPPVSERTRRRSARPWLTDSPGSVWTLTER
jgi:acetate kinase